MTSVMWKPAVTVAAIIERGGKFLFVEERAAEGGRVLNQPAGHWEPGETLAQASAREALEESTCRFAPRFLVGIYRWHSPAADETYLRFAFGGDIQGFEGGRALDEGILGTVWLSADELRARAAVQGLRSPLVLRCVEDYLAGRRYPLDFIEYVP
jgi:8-oxo-dGTP pyrophosphatase MutT (NUDIX family)